MKLPRRQLGPVVRSPAAASAGLVVSLLERCITAYQADLAAYAQQGIAPPTGACSS